MNKPVDENMLSLEELRALVPQLQALTEQHKKTQLVQQTLLNISRITSACTNLNELYPIIHTHISTLIEAQNFMVVLYDSECQHLDFVFINDQYHDDCQGLRIGKPDIEKTLTWKVVESRQPLYLCGAELSEELSRLAMPSEWVNQEPTDWLGAPLIENGHIIGALVIQSYDTNTRYSNDDLELLKFVCEHTSATIARTQNAFITEQTIAVRTEQLRISCEELENEIIERERIERLQQALFEISELSANAEDDMNLFYQHLHQTLSRLIYAPNCYIATVNWSDNQLTFEYFVDERTHCSGDRALTDGLTEYVLHTGDPQLVFAQDALQLSQNGDINASVYNDFQQQFICFLGIPLVVDGHVFGCVVVQSYDDQNTYSKQEQEIMRFVAHHISTAINRKRTSEAFRNYNKQLENEVAKRTENITQLNINLKQQITDKKHFEEQLIHQVNHDSLTGLPNRMLFNKLLSEMLEKKKRFEKQNKAMLFIDLDGFKQINDNFGHHVGDRFLIEVASRIKQSVRCYDSIARLSGDEFVVLLDDFDHMSDVFDISERIINLVSQPFTIVERQIHAGASIGIVEITSHYSSPEHIIRDADTAMYRAKSRGRGMCVMFTQELRESVSDNYLIEKQFKSALKNNEVETSLHPLTPHLTSLPPVIQLNCLWHTNINDYKDSKLVQLANKSGLSQQLDYYVITRFISHENEFPGDGCIIIPFSASSIKNNGFTEHLVSVLSNSTIEPSRLIIAISEYDIEVNDFVLRSAILSLGQHGIRFMLTDFLEYSGAISNTTDYGFDFVSCSQVLATTNNPQRQVMVQDTMGLLQKLDKTIVVPAAAMDYLIGVEAKSIYLF